MLPPSQNTKLVHPILLMIQPSAKCFPTDVPERVSKWLPAWLQSGKQFLGEFNLYFRNIFGPGEMLVLRETFLFLQKTWSVGIPRRTCLHSESCESSYQLLGVFPICICTFLYSSGIYQVSSVCHIFAKTELMVY